MSVGISHLEVGRVDDAIDVFRGLSTLEPENFVFQQYLGLALEEHKDFAGADQAYSKMLACIGDRQDLTVERTEAYLLRGRARAMLGALPAAAEDLQHAQGLEHGDDQLQMMIEEFARVMGGQE